MFKKEQEEDFRKRREEFTIGIRRTSREETFSKRRNLSVTSSQSTLQEENDNIVDEGYRAAIEKYSLG